MSKFSNVVWNKGKSFATPPQSKSVVISLCAFLIVCFTPWLIIQNDAVSEDSAYVLSSYSSEELSLVPYQYCSSGTWFSFAESSYLSPADSVSGNHFATGNRSVSDTNSNTEVQYRFIIPGLIDYFDNNQIRKVVVDLGVYSGKVWLNEFELTNIKTVDSSNNSVSTGVYELELDSLSFYRLLNSSNKFLTVSKVPVSLAGLIGPVEFDLDFFTLEDDYSGTAIAFVVGCVLLVMALFSTSAVGSKRGGSR